MQTSVAVAFTFVAALAVVLTITWYVRHENNKDYSQMELRAPLVEFKKLNRVEEANKAAEDGHVVCASCAFDNFKSAAFCAVCGEALTEEAKKRVAKGKVPANTLSTRRARVAKRNEWVRKVDVKGKVFWYRKGSSESSAAGFAITFAQEHEITIDATASKTETLNQEAQNAKLTLVEASAADATAFALGGKLESASHEKEVVEQAMSLDFPSKYALFVAKAAAALAPTKKQLLSLKVEREFLLKQALEHVNAVDAKFVRAEIQIKFIQKQVGPVGAGMGRSWFAQLSELIGAPATGLFTVVDKTNQAFFLNRNSKAVVGDDHLTHFFAAGRLLGKGLLEGKLWSFHLSTPLLKVILGQPLSASDLASFEGVNTVEELLAGVSEQLFAFLKGVYEVVPQEMLMVLDTEELDYVMCGSDVIDADEWERTSRYSETIHAHPSKKWFWQFVREMPLEYKKRLLHFTTGSTRVPIGGFAQLTNHNGHVAPFTIIGKELVISRFVRAQPCFNQMELPTYVHKKELKTNLFGILDTYDFSK